MTTPPDGMAERRRPGDDGKRYNVDWVVRLGHSELKGVLGRLVNVSVAGMLIQVPVPYTVGTFVEIEMSPEVNKFIRAVVKIIREHALTADGYYYGCLITDQSEDDRLAYTNAMLDVRRKEMRADFGRELPRARRQPRQG